LKRTSKRLLALLGGVLGLGAILRRRHRPAPAPSPAAELKAKLAVTKEPELETETQPEPQPEPEPEPKPAAGPDSVDERRADAHARARHAIEELREKSE
jgi:hypothetical protein